MSQLVIALWRLLSMQSMPAQLTAPPEQSQRDAAAAALRRAVARARELECMLRDARGALVTERARRAALSRQLSAARRRLQVVREYTARVGASADVVVRVRSEPSRNGRQPKHRPPPPPHRPELVRFRLPPSIIDE